MELLNTFFCSSNDLLPSARQVIYAAQQGDWLRTKKTAHLNRYEVEAALFHHYLEEANSDLLQVASPKLRRYLLRKPLTAAKLPHSSYISCLETFRASIMVYTINMKVDGGCRHNGYANAIGAAAVVLLRKYGGWTSWTRDLPSYPTATSQRAELTAIIFALEKALEKAEDLDNNPFVSVNIDTDSKYAHGCMTDWSFKWRNNGWINSAGNEVANRDLIEEAVDLDDRLEDYGKVTYGWIPRGQNSVADQAVKDRLDEIEGVDTNMDDEYQSSSDEY